MIARNDGTKLSSLTNDSPRDHGGNERGMRIAGGGEVEEGTASAAPLPRARSVIDPIRMENDAEIRGFLINRQPLPFRLSDDFVSSRSGPKRRPRTAPSPSPKRIPSYTLPCSPPPPGRKLRSLRRRKSRWAVVESRNREKLHFSE